MAPSSSSSQSLTGMTFTGLGNIIKILPTGSNSSIQSPPTPPTRPPPPSTKSSPPPSIFCAFSCVFSCFTDSYTGSDKQRHYAIVTRTGLWPVSTSDKIDMSKYKLRTGDFAHALLSLVVFSVLSLLDANSVRCLYPGFKDTDKILLQVLPPVIGIVAGGVFMLFPNDRYGIGYPFSSCDHDDDNSNATTSSTSTTTNNNDDKDKKETTNNTTDGTTTNNNNTKRPHV